MLIVLFSLFFNVNNFNFNFNFFGRYDDISMKNYFFFAAAPRAHPIQNGEEKKWEGCHLGSVIILEVASPLLV